ncbi:Gfo/Idh/MocA family protein [Tropicimonas sp. IMCC34011]|uniref:Gfo/Idh/MocA family protein n=1 Tax=Tropicimonas sp. IMCC34011 TaxID=2248759 RepID=UPI0013002CB9|nr:Gfo/Idh/MocA family oxidoreductase [Tropicimonas sp. IMCC34011]
MTKPLRFGVVGTAHWARAVHLPALKAHPGTELVAVMGRDPDRTAEVADTFGIRAMDDFDALLASVDAVSFVIPPAAQGDLAIRAAEAGKHLILEKPLAGDLAAATRLADAVRASGVGAICFLTRLYIDRVQEFVAHARGKAASGLARFRSGALLSGSPYSQSAWRQEEYGALWDAAPHGLSVLEQVLGPIAHLTANPDGEGGVVIEATHEGGSASRFELNLNDATVDLLEAYSFETPAGPIEIGNFQYDRPTAFGRGIDALLEQVRSGPLERSLSFALHLIAVLEAAETSLRRDGAEVPVADA